MPRGMTEKQRRNLKRRRVLSVFLAVLTGAGAWGSRGNMEGMPRVVRASEVLEAEAAMAYPEDTSREEILDEGDGLVLEAEIGTQSAAGGEGSGEPDLVQEIQEIDSSDIPADAPGGAAGLRGQESGRGAQAGGGDTLEGTAPETETEPETGAEQEPETGVGTEAQTGDTDPAHPDSAAEKVYLGIDNLHVYGGMEQSFSDGYSPVVREGYLELVIPYVASGELKGDKLTVDLEFAQQQESPCELKNYQKDVEKKRYYLAEGRMQEKEDPALADEKTSEVYLYTCQVPLLPSASPGQYSVTVKARGYTKALEQVKLDYQIFFQIPEPEPGKTQEKTAKKEKSTGAGGGSGYEGGGYGGDGAAAEEVIRQPKMLLKSCNLTGKDLEAGSSEKMRVSLQNCSQSQTMYNLKVVLQMESTALTLERNSFYFERVEPEETVDIQEAIGVMPDAEAGVVPMTFAFEYEDKKGNAATGSETMNLTVAQPVKMELEKAEIPSQVYASDTIDVPVSVLNLSRTGVYNARVHLEGTGLFPTGDVFLGNMEAGSSSGGSMNVYVGTRTMEAIGTDSGTDDGEKYGPVRGTVTLAYEDVSGETHEISQDYQTEIKKAQILSLNVEEENGGGNPWWISVLAVVILGMAVLILLLSLRLRKKNVLLEEARKTGI